MNNVVLLLLLSLLKNQMKENYRSNFNLQGSWVVYWLSHSPAALEAWVRNQGKEPIIFKLARKEGEEKREKGFRHKKHRVGVENLMQLGTLLFS